VAERQIRIQNKLGLHARAAARFSSTSGAFASEIYLIREGIEVNGKSIMGVMMLAAAKGTILTIRAEGIDAEQALDTLETLVNNRFGEEH